MKQGRGAGAAQMIFVGLEQRPRLRGVVWFEHVVSRVYFVDLSAYPKWLVVLVGTLAAVLLIWILIRLLKWTLWFVLFVVLVGGILWTGYLLLN